MRRSWAVVPSLLDFLSRFTPWARWPAAPGPGWAPDWPTRPSSFLSLGACCAACPGLGTARLAPWGCTALPRPVIGCEAWGWATWGWAACGAAGALLLFLG